MYKYIRNYFVFIGFVLIISFYWVGKYPNHFQGIKIPDFSLILIFIFAIFGVVNNIKNNEIFNRNELLFVFFLMSFPIFGNVAEFFLSAKSSLLWKNYTDFNLLERNNLLGFRSPVVSSMIFLFSARYLSSILSEKRFILSLIIGLIPHVIWGVSQFLYLFIPNLLQGLPILVGTQVEGNFNLIIVRASGLMLNAFPFSWFFMTVSISLLLIFNSYRGASILILVSMLSISRTFIITSFPLLLYCLYKVNKIFMILYFIIIIILIFYFNSDINLILDARLNGDISSQSRIETNILSINEVLTGNIFGIGFSNVYYTDSTAATILLRSGIFGVIFYFFAWFLFFRQLWVVSRFRVEVLLFGGLFFISSLLVSSVESQPGLLIIFVLYWMLRKRYINEKILLI